MMDKLAEFVSRHIHDDVTRLVLDKARWPEVDMELAVNCIESRRKLKGKVQLWSDNPGLIFPRKLSAEQCSSSATGKYKAALMSEVTGGCRMKIADLTGGLGVDSWFFSMVASEVLYCEMLPELCEAARHNFSVLGAENIRVRNWAVSCEKQDGGILMTPEQILGDFLPDIVYMDPARRGEGGKKVFLIEECTPDILTLKDEIFRFSRHIFIKLSPMADVTMVCGRLGRQCREVHVTASGGECKELLIWMDREWEGEYSIIAAELHGDDGKSLFIFKPSEEREAAGSAIFEKGLHYISPGDYIFEPGKALMKTGAFNLIAQRYGIRKLGRSTHYYTFPKEDSTTDGSPLKPTLTSLGKIYEIIGCSSLDKRSIKAIGKEYPKAEVTARNIPMDTDTLRKKLGVTSSDDTHIFGLKSDTEGNLLLVCRRQDSKV